MSASPFGDEPVAISLTELSRRMLSEPAAPEWDSAAVGAPADGAGGGEASVYELACAEGVPLMEWVRRDPARALLVAETSYARWTAVSTQAALTGVVRTTEGDVPVSRGQGRAIEARLAQARGELEAVTALALGMSGEARKGDHLLRTLYMNAVMGRDTRALTYLVDRIDGRPGETAARDGMADSSYNIYMILHELFGKQREVLEAGNGPAIVCCSRRSGKTVMLVAACLVECLRKDFTTCIYIGETMALTESLVDSVANELTERCRLRDRRGGRFNWRRMDNGSRILVRGLSNTKDPDQIRGNKAKVIVIDEFFHLKGNLLEYLQREVLQPMQMDYADDYKFICAGTPPSVKGTYGEMAWKTWDVPHFSWTWRDNPHPVDLKAREEFVEKTLRDKGLTWDTPFARREYNGEWAYDDDLLLYPNYRTYDPEEGIPQWRVSRVLFGVDYGVSDNDTVIGVAWSDDEGRGYEFFECKFSRLDIKDRTMSQLEYLKAKVKEAWLQALSFFECGDERSAKEANKRIWWDADNSDQQITQELAMRVRFDGDPVLGGLSLQIANAHKTDRKMMWDKIDELMRTGRLLLVKGGEAEHECVSTVLMRGQNGEIFNEIDDRVYHPDLLASLRYALYNVV